MSIAVRRWACLACLWLGVALGAAVPAAPTVADFLAPPAFRQPKLAPSGEKFALITQDDFRQAVLVLDIATMRPSPVATFTNVDVVDYWWKGEDWIVFLVRDFSGAFFRSADLKSGQVHDQRRLNRGSVEFSRTDEAGPDIVVRRRGFSGAEIVDAMPGDPERMLIAAATATGVELRRLNVRTGKSELVEKNPGFVRRWVVDRSGNAVAAIGRVDGKWLLLHRVPGARRWQEIALGTRSVPAFAPVAIHEDGRRLIGWDYASADTARVVARDLETGVDEVLFHSAEVDPSFNLVWDDNQSNVRAVAYETARLRFHFLNAADAALAAEVDAALPGRTNHILSASRDEARLIINSFSDTVPESYWLYDRPSRRLISLGGARPTLQQAALPTSRHFEFAARDGLRLRGRIYLPERAGSPPPAVLVTEADTRTRTRGGFHPTHQLLASRGYAVVAVDQRGTEGLGQTVAGAGDKTLDSLMADDLADAITHCASQGWLDPRRVAILGQADGGLLALSAIARHPDAFAAWINLQTPLVRGRPIGQFVHGLHEFAHDTLPAAMERELRHYSLQLDPLEWLRQVRVPTLLYYTPRDYEHRGDLAQKGLARRNVPCVMLRRPGVNHWSHTSWEDLQRQQHHETVRVYEDIVRFLDRHVPVDG